MVVFPVHRDLQIRISSKLDPSVNVRNLEIWFIFHVFRMGLIKIPIGLDFRSDSE